MLVVTISIINKTPVSIHLTSKYNVLPTLFGLIRTKQLCRIFLIQIINNGQFFPLPNRLNTES